MKFYWMIIGIICCIVCTGCVSQNGGPASSGDITLPATAGSLTQGKPLPMNQPVLLATPNTTVEVSIDSFEIGPVQDNGDQEVTIYIAAKNTGKKPVMFVWFSTLTDPNGKTYGGVGISHGGSGARSGWIQPNQTEAARDFVTIRSDRDLAALKKGAVLDVAFMEKVTSSSRISPVPDYRASWKIDSGTIR